MSKLCSNCSSLIEEQRSKIHLLETRLRDLVRAYKVVCKERDHFQTINQQSINTEVDTRQQKRIAELEQSVINMSTMCGNLELGRKQDKDRIKELQDKYEHLSNELNQTKCLQKQLLLSTSSIAEMQPKKVIDIHCQTDLKPFDFGSVEFTEQWTQTDDEQSIIFENKCNEIKVKNETAIITPLVRNDQKFEINDFSDSSQCSFEMHNNKDNAQTLSNNGISLFHLNELARKELELADYRLRIREYECSQRELQWNYTNDKYKLQTRIADLEHLNKKLLTSNCTKTPCSNNINIAYVKNVLDKLVETTDRKQKQLMTNALIAALDSMQTEIN